MTIQGVRGQPAADVDRIRRILQATSTIMGKNEPIQQMDLNPIILYPKGASIVDAIILLGE